MCIRDRVIDSAPGGGDTELVTDRVLVQDQTQVHAETLAQFGAGIDLFGWALLGFALVSLFVSIFIIANTFSIVVGQRIRELGLLRAVGATPKQIWISVVAESFIIGLLASVVGIGAGVGIAFGLSALLEVMGIPLPAFDVILSPFTLSVALLVGTAVTVLSSVLPAVSAARTAPITAITGSVETAKKSAVRYLSLIHI